MESYGVLRDLAIKSTSQVRVNGDLSEAFPLSAGVGQGLSTLFDIFIDDLVAGLHDTCSGIAGADRCSKFVICDADTILTPMAKVDGLHPHLAQQMADAGNFTKGDGISPWEVESCSVPAKDRGTPGHRHRH
jgi:hypothetical protein